MSVILLIRLAYFLRILTRASNDSIRCFIFNLIARDMREGERHAYVEKQFSIRFHAPWIRNALIKVALLVYLNDSFTCPATFRDLLLIPGLAVLPVDRHGRVACAGWAPAPVPVVNGRTYFRKTRPEPSLPLFLCLSFSLSLRIPTRLTQEVKPRLTVR